MIMLKRVENVKLICWSILSCLVDHAFTFQERTGQDKYFLIFPGKFLSFLRDKLLETVNF